MLGTVAKAGKVLDLFTIANPEWGVCEVAERLRIPKSSAHGLLATLSAIGLLRRSGGRYRLGWRIVELNRTLFSSTALLAGTGPVLRQLADQLGVVLELAALHHYEVTVIDRAVGAPVANDASLVRYAAVPAHTSALGKVLLAYAGARAIDAFVDEVSSAPRASLRTPSESRLRSELEATRLRGLGYDVEESHLGLCSIAAPIRDADGSVHTALGIKVPALSFHRNRELLGRSVQRAAARIAKDARSLEHEYQAAGRYPVGSGLMTAACFD